MIEAVVSGAVQLSKKWKLWLRDQWRASFVVRVRKQGLENIAGRRGITEDNSEMICEASVKWMDKMPSVGH